MSAALQEAVERFAGRGTAPRDGPRQRFVVLSSQRQPRCLLPAGHGRAASESFRFYTAETFGARVFEGLLKQVVRCGWSRWPLHSLSVAEPLGLKAIVAEATGECHPVFAMLLGASGKYRKLTLQVMRPGGETLGYVKLGLTRAGGARVRHEANMLQAVSALAPQVPRVLYAGEWQDSYLLLQSPVEGPRGPAKLDGMHIEFLEKLAAIHHVSKPGVQVVEEVGMRWNEVAWRCHWRWQGLGAEALTEARQELEGITVPCGLAHGDFDPWNTHVRDGQLSVFDWESSEWEAPLGWDAFHFSVQVASRRKKNWRARFRPYGAPGARGLFLLYLLASLGKALDEEPDSFAGIEYRRQALEQELALND